MTTPQKFLKIFNNLDPSEGLLENLKIWWE